MASQVGHLAQNNAECGATLHEKGIRMRLRLISPAVEYHYEWQLATIPPPAVLVASPDKVWVKAANSTADNVMYFEQQSWFHLNLDDLTEVEKPE